MNELKFNLSIVLRAPFISQGTGAMRFGLDVCPNTHDGKLVLPGRLLKGMLKEKLELFSGLVGEPHQHELKQIIIALFGQSHEHDAGSGRGNLHFPWRLTETRTNSVNTSLPSQRHRIKIDADTGAVKEGHLQIVDTKYPTGTEITFEGELYYTPCKQLPDSEVVIGYLKKAATQIRALGAFKNVGFGQVIDFKIEQAEHKAINTDVPFVPQNNQWPIALTFNHPICFAASNSQASNHFESNAIIAGNIIKAGMASQVFKLDPEHPLRTHFDELIVRHAIPTEKSSLSGNQEPVRHKQLPLSLIKPDIKGKPLFANIAQQNEPVLFKDPSSEGYQYKSAVFYHDWKQDPNTPENKAEQLHLSQTFGNSSHEPKTSFSVHTAIDSKDGTADEGQLYSMQVIETDETVWLTEITLPEHLLQPNDTVKISQALSTIFGHGLPNMGKTKARMNATPSSHKCNKLQEIPSDLVTIKLESNALLFTESDLQHNGSDLLALYQSYFEDLLASSTDLKLHSYYADQQLGGGNYYYHRFSKAGHSEAPIINYLTKAGSVFTFQVSDKQQALPIIKQWLNEGLPLPKSLQHLTWQDTPYLQQNGFGEISVLTNAQANYKLDELEQITVSQIAGGNHD